MRRITVYGPLVCGGCTFTIMKLTRAFKNTDVVIEKVVIDDPLNEAVLAAKLGIKAQQLGTPVELTEPLTDEEIATTHSAPYVFVDGAFQWNSNIPDNVDELFGRYQALTSVDVS